MRLSIVMPAYIEERALREIVAWVPPVSSDRQGESRSRSTAEDAV
jgi:hypothetical protein